jgi:glycerol-3-phosphate acyltransferase PlsY
MMWTEQIQSVDALPALASAAGSYALGCFATGYYLVRFRTGRDIREIESRNIGARNVGRVLGKSGFILTTIGDAVKGALAVGATKYFTGSSLLAALAVLFVVIGHIWPMTLNWRGGKGVVTSGGAMLVFDYRIALVYGAVVAVGFAITRRTTMPGLVAYLVVPFASHLLDHTPVETVLVTILTVLILFAHRQNFIEQFPSLALRRGMSDKPQHTKP